MVARVSQITVNGIRRQIDADPGRSLLSVLRDDLDLTGTKYGCGEGECGACTVLLDGQPVRSCITPVSAAAAKPIVTIEDIHHPVQDAFLEAGAIAVRLLYLRHDRGGGGITPQDSPPHAAADRAPHEWQHLPLRHLSTDRRRDPKGGPEPMLDQLDRRDFMSLFGSGLLVAFSSKAQESGIARRVPPGIPQDVDSPGCTSARMAWSPSIPAN